MRSGAGRGRGGPGSRALDQGLELGLALAGHGHLGAQLVARGPQHLVDVAARGVHLGGDLVLDEGLVELPRGGEPPAAGEVVLRRREASPGPATRAHPCCPGRAPAPRVLDDGLVVVLPLLGVAAVARAAPPVAQPARAAHRVRIASPARAGQRPPLRSIWLTHR